MRNQIVNRDITGEINNQEIPTAVRVAGVVILIVFAFVGGIITGRTINIDGFGFDSISKSSGKKVNLIGDLGGDDTVEDLDFDLYWEVWEIMSNEYVDSSLVDQESMFYDSIKGMVNSFNDPATIFLDPEDTSTFNQNSAGNFFSGIGAELGYEGGRIIVITPLDGSPAEAAGIRPGDIILKIDGEELKSDENIFDVVLKIRGEEGSEVVLTILHPGADQVEDLTITRGEITVPSMTFTYMEDQDIALVDLSRFTDASLTKWKENWDQVVDQTIDSGASSMIIDLRGNPGGFFDAAVYAASDFLPENRTVAQQEDRKGKVYNFEVEREGKLLDIPLVVLVNEGSASASEILSGALQVNDRAEVIGVETYGKGTAQNVVEFDDGSSLHITILKWLLPDGTWLNNENPIVPDQKVELTDEDFKNGDDPQMDAAVQFLNR